MDNFFTFVTGVLGFESGTLLGFIGAVAVWAAPITGFVSVVGLVSIWLERKISAHIQCRVGPMEVGPHGALQTLADGIKLLGKEDIVPKDADRVLFALAPMLAFASTFVAYAVIPFSEKAVIADLNLGVFFLASVGSLEAIAVVMAGWSSNNKWSLFGAIRAATQVVSYEIPLGLSLLTAVLVAGSMSLNDITYSQAGWIWNWLVFRNPFMWAVFVIYFIASLAECKRSPFDLPEAESELVSGFHTEYSGMRFAIFFLAEYGAMYVVSAVGVVLFLGGWYTGIPAIDNIENELVSNLIGAATIITKSFLLICVQMWIRWTLPRIRLDQMMDLCLKYLLPFSLVLLVIVALWQAFQGPVNGGNSITGMIMLALTVVAFIAMRKVSGDVMRQSASRAQRDPTLPIIMKKS
ncbi:MAG: NADH-quinone oxidoreductase subunit NuoH [Planctomycetes bacterium]|nr:NADH-quinone oxidoreductase subunit NuoH [Planctomycetota bacterium]